MRRYTFILLAIALVFGASGCRQCGKCRLFQRSDNARLDAPASPRMSSDPLLIPPPAGGLPTPPPPSLDAPRGGVDLPPPVVPETRNYIPQEKQNGKELLLPDPLPGEPSSKSRGYLDDPAEIRKTETTAKSAPKELPAKTVNGITGFALVRDGIATGRKPSIEGFDSLKSANYKTVVYLHAPKEDVSAAKVIAEKRGLSFVAIEVSATNVKEAAGRIVDVVSDSSQKPMFVCDDDGVRTGCVWYAYFRVVEGLSDDAAQVRAAPFGLRDATGADKAKLFAAVQELLAKR